MCCQHGCLCAGSLSVIPVCPHNHRRDHSVPPCRRWARAAGPAPPCGLGPGAPHSEVVTGAGLQDRKIAHCPFHMLMPSERETFLARKKLLEYMGLQLRQAVFAKECQWDPKVLHLSKRGGRGGRSGRVGAWAWWAASGVGSCSGLLRQLRAGPEAPLA